MKNYHFKLFIIFFIFLLSGCGPARKDPLSTVIDTAFSIPAVVLSVPSAIITADPSKIGTAISSSYNRISGQCTETANYNAPECIKLREERERQITVANINNELSRIKTMSLPQLENYYEAEIAKNPNSKPREVVDFTKNRLIDENKRLGTFQGYLRAAQVSGNSSYVTQNLNLVKTTEDKRGLEQFQVMRTDDLNNLFDIDFKAKLGSLDKQHAEHMGILARHSDSATREMAGILHISKSKSSPIKVSLGRYKLKINVTMHLPSRFVRQSRILGNADRNEDYTENATVTADITPPNMSTIVNVNFGKVQTAYTKRGSMGGVEARMPTGEPTFTVDIVKAEVI